MSEPLAPWVVQFLRRVGIETPDPTIEIHRRIVAALLDVGQGRPLGAQLAAVRYVVRDEHSRAGERLAVARADHEERVLSRKIELLRGQEKVSATLAKDIAEKDAITHRRIWLRAEMEERTLREFLKSIADDLAMHQTDRADLRSGDRAEGYGLTGGA